jgi:murein L,D-transpeptidase YcbB/YkuD
MVRVLLLAARLGAALIPLSLFAAFPAAADPSQLALQAPLTLEESGLRARFADVLDTRIQLEAAAAQDDQNKAWLAQLRSFYASRAGKPVWVSSHGWNPKAQAALSEIAQAGDWGLNAADFTPPQLVQGITAEEDLAQAELALSRLVIKYASHARGGRIPDPSALSLWLDRAEDPVFATAVMIEMISVEDAAQALRDMHPKSTAFKLLRDAFIATRREIENPKAPDPADLLTSQETLKLGASHPDVLILRRKLKVPAKTDAGAQVFDETLANKLDDWLDARDIRVRWGRIDDKVRAAFNRPPAPPSKADLARIVANMERWRWLPRDLGRVHIWNNLPEFMTRVVKDDAIIHEERIIVGQRHTQTPVFSNAMSQVVFQPEWGVPPSIKINDLLPKLQGGDYEVLKRRNMRILSLSGKELSPRRFRWHKVDIRDVGIYQRSGGGNPLGRVKFLFPNKHHVYMHDTNNRSLFGASERLFSHGCVRVRNPERFAKVILGLDKNWDEAKVQALLDDWDASNNKIDLDRPIPVHNVYFTLVPGEERTLIRLDDPYGHDARVTQALAGVPFQKIAQNDPARSQQRELDEAAPPMVRKALKNRGRDDD